MFKEMIENYTKRVDLMDVLSLAFLGDAIHSLYVRTIFVTSKDYKQKDLQAMTSAIVCAKNQSKTLQLIESELEEDERQIMQRARNAHTNNKAKNSTLKEYKYSTAYEALIGYLYMQKKFDKMQHFLEKSMENS